MMYPYMTLNDDTEITHSEMYPDGKVKVYIETQMKQGDFMMLFVGYQIIHEKFTVIQSQRWCILSNLFETMHI